MITTNDILKAIDDGGFSKQDLVSILELSISKLDIDTVSGMARSEKKLRKGLVSLIVIEK